MRKIKMVAHTMGAPDGLHVMNYEAGQTYEVPDSLAVQFIEKCDPPRAAYVTDPAEPIVQAKSIYSAPENKAMDGAEDDKTPRRGRTR